MTPTHPYYPRGVEIANYIPNDHGTLVLVLIFAAGCAAILLPTYLLITNSRPQISTGDLRTALWFTLCGCIHLFFEGYYAWNFHHMGSRMSLFGQLWKEYALSDSRYLVPDSFMFSMESITALFWGPLSFWLVSLIVQDNEALRYPVQIIVSLGQLYGDVLYYGTAGFAMVFQSTEYSRPERWCFWGYFVFLNAFWVVIPLALVLSGVSACKKAFLDARANGAKKNI